MKPPKLPNIKNYVHKDTKFIKPNDRSHLGLNVPEIMMEYGKSSSPFKMQLPILDKLLCTIYNMKKSYSTVKNNPVEDKRNADEDLFQEIEAFAKSLGCNAIGYTKVDNHMIYSNKEILYPNAIVLTMEMDYEPISHAPSTTSLKEIFRTYRDLGVTVNKLATLLRKNGFQVQAGPALGGDVNYPMLAQKAGLGICGKHGLLISPGVGSRQRIAAVYTNIENLPYTDNHKYDWIKDFCANCGKCARKCPAQAIYSKTKIFDNGTKQHIDFKKCAVPFSNDYGCSICVKECIFSNKSYEEIKSNFLK